MTITYNTLDHVIDMSAYTQRIASRATIITALFTSLAVGVYSLIIAVLLMVDLTRDAFGACVLIVSLAMASLIALGVDDIKTRTQAQISAAIATLYNYHPPAQD